MRFTTLEDVTTPTLSIAFNAAFANYHVPLQLNPEQLAAKFLADGFSPKHSVAAFDGDTLAGFIFHGIETLNGKLTAYNGGTGVLPDYRGKGLSMQMYEFILPVLKKEGVEKSILEVICENSGAIKVYKNVGFTRKRKVICVKGSIQPKTIAKEFTVKHHFGEALMPVDDRFYDFYPTWQNTVESINRQHKDLMEIAAYEGSEKLGLLVLKKANGRILHFAVRKDYRYRGIGGLLLSYAALENPNLSMINIDNSKGKLADFLTERGFEYFLSQYEMEMPLHG
ncbi:MAG: GNAT family N-acetyltransferase [Bacteroidota bacterium]